MRVHFICNGNAYRSRMAQAYFQSLHTGIEAISSGTRADKSRDRNVPVVVDFTADFLRRHGVDPSGLNPHPVQLTQEMLQKGDVTVVINDIALDLAKKVVTLPTDVRVWDISDVEEQDAKGEEVLERGAHTERIFVKIKQNVDELARELTTKTN
jgi:protein-tyrosine-phosphatase